MSLTIFKGDPWDKWTFLLESRWYASTQAETAFFFGLATDHMRKQEWFRSVPKTEEGFDLRALTLARFRQAFNAARATPEDGSGASLTQRRITKLDEDIIIRQDERRLRQGALLVRVEVVRGLAEMTARVRACLIGLSSQIASLVPSEQKAWAIEAVRQAVDRSLSTVWAKRISISTIDKMILEEAKLIEERSGASKKRNGVKKRKARRKVKHV